LEGWLIQFANPVELIADDLIFRQYLIFIRDVLVVAASTLSEMGAARCNSERGWFQYLKEFTASITFLLLH